MIELHQADCMEWEPCRNFECVFVDPPDNIDLGYDEYEDNRTPEEYGEWLNALVWKYASVTPKFWISFNARHFPIMGRVVDHWLSLHSNARFDPHVQVFTFGQNSQKAMANCHRPLWLLHNADAKFYPDAIRVPSWRQKNRDKRADPRGKVPGDVFDFPRVTGNSKQRRRWHPTQLHEGILERVIQYSTKEHEVVLDPCTGTGTTLRVAERLNRSAVGVDLSRGYCKRIAKEMKLSHTPHSKHYWSRGLPYFSTK